MPHRLMLADETLLQQLTLLVRQDRALSIERRLIGHRRRLDVALEIKGLKANMLQLRSIVSALNTDAAAAIEKGAALQSHIGDLKDELANHVSDIEFAAGLLGNSGASSASQERPGAGSGGPVVSQNGQGAIPQPEQINEPGAAAGPPIANTFRAEAEQQIAEGHK